MCSVKLKISLQIFKLSCSITSKNRHYIILVYFLQVGSGVPAVTGAGVGGQVSAQQTANAPPQGTQAKAEFNTASLCRFGQETVQDIVSRTQEVFTTLKTIQVFS